MSRKKIILTIILVLFLALLILSINAVLIIKSTQTTKGSNWDKDGVILAKDRISGDYKCFGCGKSGFGKRLCIDPAPDRVEFLNETEKLHCTEDFVVVDLR